METLLHEFVHLRRAQRHDADFHRLVTSARGRLGWGPERAPSCAKAEATRA